MAVLILHDLSSLITSVRSSTGSYCLRVSLRLYRLIVFSWFNKVQLTIVCRGYIRVLVLRELYT